MRFIPSPPREEKQMSCKFRLTADSQHLLPMNQTLRPNEKPTQSEGLGSCALLFREVSSAGMVSR